MKTTRSLGQEIARLRLQSGFTLRGLASRLEVSAAHLSDIERNHRRPSEKLLRKIAHELRDAGATFDSLEEFVTGIDPETREWVASTPGVRRFLRTVKESGSDPGELLRILEKAMTAPPRKAAAGDRKKKTDRKKAE